MKKKLTIMSNHLTSDAKKSPLTLDISDIAISDYGDPPLNQALGQQLPNKQTTVILPLLRSQVKNRSQFLTHAKHTS